MLFKNKTTNKKLIINMILLNFLMGISTIEAMQVLGKYRYSSSLHRGVSKRTFTTFNELKLDKLNWYSEKDIPKEIPILDLKNMSLKEKMNCFKEAAEISSCIYVKNYTDIIKYSQVEELINVTRMFFNEAPEKKLMYERSPETMRGYGAYQKEKSERLFGKDNFSDKGDPHENFSWGPRDNVYPNTNFKEIWENYFRSSCLMAKTITELAINSFEMKGINWENMANGDHILKVLDFRDEANNLPYRIKEHGDTSIITILNQIPADNGYIGLQVLVKERGEKEGKFIGVPAVKGTMIIKFGEAMLSLSEGKIKPTIHRVVNPEIFKGSSRLSIPFFLHPNPDTEMYYYEGSFYNKHYNKDDNSTNFDTLVERAYKDARQ